MQYAQKCPHVICRDKMVRTICLDLIYYSYRSNAAFDCNDVPPKVSTAWRQRHFIEPGSFVGASDDFLPLARLNLIRESWIAIQEIDKVEPRHCHGFDQLSFQRPIPKN